MTLETVEQRVAHLKALPIIKEVLDRLARELPSSLLYHAPKHTEDVLQEVVLLAVTDGLSERNIELLAIAAAFHDAGFIKSPVTNEPIGAAMAKEAMQKNGTYTSEEIELVERMILDTTLLDTGSGPRQVATTDLSRYLLDADLSNFGRDDFFDKGELQRQELGYDQEIFRKKSFELLNSHRWLTNSARALRQSKKEENIRLLKEMLPPDSVGPSIGFDRLGFLAKLSLLLNSSLDSKRIIKVALKELKTRLNAEAATIFLLDESGGTLTFWAMQGSGEGKLEGLKMPAAKGIVGWVISHQESLLIDDAAKDPRFFSAIDKEAGFVTRNMVCSPLTVRGERRLGAVQALNKVGSSFNEEDLVFMDQFSNQIALAIDNARLFEAVRERNKKLEILDLRKNEMMTVIAHEFRTPLNLIGTSAELLASGTLNDEATVDRMCGILNKGIQRLTKLIGEVKNLSLSTSQKLEVQKAPLSVTELLNQVSDSFKDAVAERKLTWELKCPSDIGFVSGDFPMLVVVLKNLVSNAIRFTPNGGKITLSATRNAELVTISVEDTGIGIPQDQLSLIFEKFYEVGSSLQHSSGDHEFKSGGLGLGLATAKAILAAHAANIEVKSTPNVGSTFSFALHTVEK